MAKFLFIDRDGTLINEPDDKQIDSLEKIALLPHVIPALLRLIQAGYQLVMVSNQDGLGTDSFAEQDFIKPQQFLIDMLASQGIVFSDVLICPHTPAQGCECRKPRVGLVLAYLRDTGWDRANSYVIGDRITDLELADNMGIHGIQYSEDNGWPAIADSILQRDRFATVTRNTNETQINVSINLDQAAPISIDTGIGFFNHMLEQLAKHAGWAVTVSAKGDLHIDPHHTIEDTALTLGQALRQALADKQGIGRYGFVLPMDEALTEIAIDLSGRAYCEFHAQFPSQQLGDLPTELVSHFFRSLADSLQASIHVTVRGRDTHHMVESSFKALGRALRQASQRVDDQLPTTKGVL